MARPIDPAAQYRVSIHNIGGYRYASTQPAYQDPETGKTKHRRIHVGGKVILQCKDLFTVPCQELLTKSCKKVLDICNPKQYVGWGGREEFRNKVLQLDGRIKPLLVIG